jgi:hypothetical protein
LVQGSAPKTPTRKLLAFGFMPCLIISSAMVST